MPGQLWHRVRGHEDQGAGAEEWGLRKDGRWRGARRGYGRPAVGRRAWRWWHRARELWAYGGGLDGGAGGGKPAMVAW